VIAGHWAGLVPQRAIDANQSDNGAVAEVVVLDADELAWTERFNYDDAEVAQFKRDWRDFEPDVDADGGLALDDFAAFVVLMFGSANAAALRDYRELPREHKRDAL
jgi:hypothetical protein